MASKSIFLSALLAAPAAAFVPSGSLRATTSATTTQDVSRSPASFQEAGAPSALPVVAAGALLLGAGAALRKGSRNTCSKVERKVVGRCEPILDKFDPLNLGSTDTKMERYTAVEIKHGRIAMIACLGYVIPECYRFPGCEEYDSGLDALTSLPFLGWFQIFAFIGAHETLIKPRDGGLGDFDLGWGIELLEGQDEEEVERKQTVERNNGRLAMIGIMGLMVQDGLYGNPIESMNKGFWGGNFEWIVKDIPICQGGMC
mmetsp:Transcript_55476/g.132256  ORF Transcript_55476/g.132256 Transcript_55476/m.132256 type:complete len:258 (+) Transcript_55476:109-882(+)|eukprot:CAMPEP_0178448302 /NCGR_PEP_ID=MMETSP0689_2-20121128/41909_1 /TAXON_ID=160604 /ORGANISM="Amphidinium massartii, Strain CS-259" /LENGTH=257 /DNA_ID=CAMNT_0020073473 /DNA_START=103 /DNA_END=876 /DNA_ORIENTATION=-